MVSDEVGQQFADDIGAIFQSTSALSESGINKLFDNIGRKIIDPDFDYKDSDKVAKANYDKKQNKQKDEEKDKRVKLGDAKNNNNNNKKGGCC